MVCPSCGHEVSEGTNFCLNCGAKLEMEAAETQAPMEQVSQGAETQTQEEKRSTASKAMSNAPFNVLSIAGLAVSCLSLVLGLYGLTGIAGVILSVLGYRQIKHTQERGKSLALVGIILGCCSAIFCIAILLFTVTAYVGIFSNLFS